MKQRKARTTHVWWSNIVPVEALAPDMPATCAVEYCLVCCIFI